jgi:methylmalonyl-CoA mutase, N-terminal domain
MRDVFGARDPKSQMLRFHTQTAGVQLTAQQPEVNLARVTVQALAAVLGGTQSLHTNAYDEAIALPTEKAARLALRTQQVLAYETDLGATADPLAGSYAIESMTARIRDDASELIQRVEDMGGAVAAIEQGLQKAEIERSAYQVAQQIDSGERVVVGVNKFTTAGDDAYAPLRVDPAIEQQQADRLAELRRGRDAAEVSRCLDAVGRAAAGQDNVLYPLRAALAAKATVGEVCDALRAEWGVYQPADVY